MTREEILKELNEVVQEVFDDESIIVNETTTANDIEDWDSLMHISLVNAVEKAFDVKFEMKDIVSWKNVGEMINTIESEQD